MLKMLNLNLFDCRIRNVQGHCEIYDCNGNFVVSGDTQDEAIEDLKTFWLNGQDKMN